MDNKLKLTTDEVLNSPFDISTHKKYFINYLEVMIDPEGTVHYAVPSHLYWLINYIKKPEETIEDYIYNNQTYDFDQLCYISNCVGVWGGSLSYIIGNPNEKQKETIRELQNNNLMKEVITNDI